MTNHGIKWLASFPKSGNTWARLFLLNWHRDADEPVHPNELGRIQFSPSCDASHLWEYATGFNLNQKDENGEYILPPVSLDTYLRLRTHVQACYARRAVSQGAIAYMKTHAINMPYKGAYPTIDWGITQKAVYFVRDPRKVVPSFAAHLGKTYGKTIEDMGNINDTLLKNYGVPCPIGSWSKNVESWKGKAVLIRYEDLPDGFEALLEAFELPMDERFHKAVAFTKMQTLQDMERSEGFSEASTKAGQFFGKKHRPLNRQQRRQVAAEHAEVMLEMGYSEAAEEVGKAA